MYASAFIESNFADLAKFFKESICEYNEPIEALKSIVKRHLSIFQIYEILE